MTNKSFWSLYKPIVVTYGLNSEWVAKPSTSSVGVYVDDKLPVPWDGLSPGANTDFTFVVPSRTLIEPLLFWDIEMLFVELNSPSFAVTPISYS